MLITGEPPKQAEDRKKPNPSACTGLAEHLLPQRHELIQSFLKGLLPLGNWRNQAISLRTGVVSAMAIFRQQSKPQPQPSCRIPDSHFS